MKKSLLLLTTSLLLTTNGLFAQDFWTKKGDFPAPEISLFAIRNAANGIGIAGKGYMSFAQSPGTQEVQFWEFDPASNVWTQKAGTPGSSPVTGSFAVGSKGYFLISGTAGSATGATNFWSYDPAVPAWTPKSSFPGTGATIAFSIGNKGYFGSGGDNRDFWEYDISYDSWTRKSDCPGDFTIGFGIGNKGYVGMGRITSNIDATTFWEYNPVTDQWTVKANFPSVPRSGAAGFSIANKGYIGTGYFYNNTGIAPVFLGDWWEYDPATDMWIQKAGVGDRERMGATGFNIGNKGYVGLGIYSYRSGATNGGFLNDFWEYTPAQVVNQIPAVAFDPTTVTTVAGSGAEGFADGPGTEAAFNHPAGVCAPDAGNIYVTDQYNRRIRRINHDGIVTTFAGNGSGGLVDGDGSNAQFCSPNGMATDAVGNLYVADECNHAIRKITPAGIVSTLAGNGTPGRENGPGALARFYDPRGVAVDGAGNVYVADTYNRLIRKITPGGMVSTFAGDAPGQLFTDPINLFFDAEWNLFVIQSYGPLRKITPDGTVSTISPTNFYGFQQGLAIDNSGGIYLSVTADGNNNYIYKMHESGMPAIVAGTMNGFRDSTGVDAKFSFPAGLSIDKDGNVYVADRGNNRIRKLSRPSLYLTTNAGAPSAAGYFTVSANYVQGAILLKVPAGYEVSENETGPWAGLMSINPVEGRLNVFKIYIRLKAAAAAGVYNDSIELSAIGAVRQRLPIAGFVRDTIPPVITCVPPQIFCADSANQYTVPQLIATDASYIREIQYIVRGATSRSGTGNNASGLFNPGKSVITWTAFDWWNNSSSCETAITVDRPLRVTVPDVYPLLIWGKSNTLYLGFGPTSVTLTANAAGGSPLPGGKYNYAWSNGANSKSINVHPSVAGRYNYSVTITDSLGCQSTVTKAIEVVDVRCGPKMNRVLICWPNRHGNMESCINENQVLLALFFGAKLGDCGNVTARSTEPSVAETGKGISLFPNPNKGSFVLQLKQLNSVEIRILDQSGRLVLRQVVNGGNGVQNLVMELGRVTNGLYLVQAICNDGIYTVKMMVQQ